MKHIFTSILVLLIALLITACGPSGATPDESGELVILQIDDAGGMRFDPSDVVLTAGQKVRIILENQGEKNHEFMIGQNVVRTADGAANGFEVDFFEGIEDLVQVTLGEGAMLMIDGETVMMGGGDMDMGEDGMDMGDGGNDEGMDMGDDGMNMESGDEHADDDHGMGHTGWMVMSESGSGTIVIEFTVPADRVGEWEMACFEDNGAHYEDGMRGTLTVVAP